MQIAHEVARAGAAFAAHVWRSRHRQYRRLAGGARAAFLSALVGSVGTPGGTAPNAWDKFFPAAPMPPPQSWNELLFPPEWPLAHYEMSFLLPHFLQEGRGKLDIYFTRVYNPVWTNPDGLPGSRCFATSNLSRTATLALTPTWSETAWFADYVLPMGHAGAPRPDEPGDPRRQVDRLPPAGLPVAWSKQGQKCARRLSTYQANPGEVWEEDEFWIKLSWAIDPDGSLGIRAFRVALPPRQNDHRRTILPLDF